MDHLACVPREFVLVEDVEFVCPRIQSDSLLSPDHAFGYEGHSIFIVESLVQYLKFVMLPFIETSEDILQIEALSYLFSHV